jgi:inosine-uridine nucleoside N-ribohydrolase
MRKFTAEHAEIAEKRRRQGRFQISAAFAYSAVRRLEWTSPMKQISLLAALFLVFAGLTTAVAETPRRAIIDTDPGVDDAMAILLALNSPELKIEALTVVPGNVEAWQGLENALKIVSLAGRCDVPVAGGAQHPLNQKLITAQFWHGKNGLAGVELPATKCKADPRFGPDLIIELVHKYPHEITLIPVGPLTNIALAVSKDPSIVPLVKDIVIMGGSITGGNVNGAAEANIYNDPEAAAIVFNAGWMVTMVGSDVGERTIITRKYLTELQSQHGAESDFVAKLADFYITRSEKSGYAGAAMYDPLAVGAAIDPTLVTLKDMHVDVETRGEFTRGETVANRNGSNENNVLHGDHYEIEGAITLKANARVCVASDAERFLNLFINRIKGK